MRSEGGERHALAALFDPSSIVVVGASADPGKRGYHILRALGASGYRGEIFAVNPRGGTILGHLAYPSVGALPRPADLAVLCTPAATTPELVETCGARGIRAAVILAVGFGESGDEGRELERRLAEAGRSAGVRLVGPNTSGLLNAHSGANLIGARGVRPGGIALVVQSGNMALSLMNEASDRGADGISICVGVGNEVDVGFRDALDFLRTHADTRAVIVYAEGFRDARGFLRSAARLAAEKPVVLVKAGRTGRGAQAALSHTGAVAGPYEMLRAGLRQAGVVELLRTDEILAVTETLAFQPPLGPDRGIAILSDGGGQGTLAMDALSSGGVRVASLSEGTRARLRALLGAAAAVGNPVDLAGAADANPAVFAEALEILVADDAVGAVLVVGLFGGYAIRFDERLAPAEAVAARGFARAAASAGTGLVVHSMYARRPSEPLDLLRAAHVPVVESLDVACRCVVELARRDPGRSGRWAETLADVGEEANPGVGARAATADTARRALTEPQARRLLEGCGLSFARTLEAHDAEGAARAAGELAGPLVLKAIASGLVHKSEAGGVILDVVGADEARAAFETLARRTAAWRAEHGSGEEDFAALVTEMAPPARVELLVGAHRDPGLGPVLTIGAGGVWTEALGDVTHRVLPIGPGEVADMLTELRVHGLLAGGRGHAAVGTGPVEEAAAAVARCLEDPEVLEVEINPLAVYPDRAVPLDARIAVRA